ncbi:MAG: DUF4832 domain-containing protein [Tidjanibacter sp.]|nr:DUF4832 domain-containing protein [Tidjanibacter sp.]
MIKKFFAIAAMAAMLIACGETPEPQPNPGGNTEQPGGNEDEGGNTEQPKEEETYPDLTEVTYTSHNKVIVNPERGLYTQKSYHSVDDGSLSSSASKAARTANRSLFLTLFYLTDYIDSDIEQEYLDNMQTTFDNIRKGGTKAIVRFAYKNNEDVSNKPWDATQEQVARHIEQVAPILRKNADVILTVQAGFIGVWGEWYYTSNFHFPISTAEQYADRRKVVDALLEALPTDRQVELRTPEFKMKMYNVGLADTLTVATAHNGSDLARLAGHNDCFLASSSDTGTFNNGRGKGDWLFWDAETRYTIMGGETCGVSSYSKCENSIKRMEEQHWTYLNLDYHRDVINGWNTDGCFTEIQTRLGYRLALTKAFFTPEPTVGGDFRAVLKIENSGFAAPMNPRGCELVLVSEAGAKTTYKLNVDPRFWFEKSVNTIDTTITLPAEAGKYKLYLNLPDGYESLASDPKYSIQLANNNVWDDKTGYNLLTEVTIK